LPVEILLEPRSEELRRLFRDSVRFAEKVFKEEYIGDVKVIGAEPERALEAYNIVLDETKLSLYAEWAKMTIETRYKGIYIPRFRIVVLSRHGIGDLKTVFHEFVHAATYEKLIEDFIDMAREEFEHLYELIGIAREYVADVELVRNAYEAVKSLLIEYPALYGDENYVRHRNRRLSIDAVWPVSYYIGNYIERSAEAVRKLMDAAYREIERRVREGKSVSPIHEEVIRAHTKAENIEDAMYCIVRRWTLIPKADEILSRVMQRLPADLYEEFKHLDWA